MNNGASTYFDKLRYSLPWLIRYPFARASSYVGEKASGQKHVIFTIANHFEPSWKPSGLHDVDIQRRRVDEYYKLARKTGDAVRDSDGTKFRHTNFFPGEQYDHQILTKLSEMQAEGLGEVEVHLHHGVDAPDSAENLKKVLTDFRDVLAEEHRCLSRMDGKGDPMYAFVHGNLALANSCGGRFCGVDDEMQILKDTGCYVDMTLPTAPDQSQVPILNKIYECGLPIAGPVPHRKGRTVKASGARPQLPLIFTGPLVFHWSEWKTRLLMPRIDDGSLALNQRLDRARFRRWISANITVEGQPEWIFVKLSCHGFIERDQSACIGGDAEHFFGKIIAHGEKTNEYKIHFATAREACNMVLAAIDGQSGSPHDFRDYRLKAIMSE